MKHSSRPSPLAAGTGARAGLTLALMTVAALSLAAEPPATPAAAADSSVATIILVRHAERDTTLIGPDQPLRAAGILRAQALVHTLGGSGISTLYVTPWLRNRQTALPLATALAESLTVVDEIAETVRRLRTLHFGRTALVVGHSNTVPEIITALTGRPFPTPGEVPYDGMWVVTLARDGHASLVTLRYGTPADRTPERHAPPGPPKR